jgi:lantibiotic modifying enzyme
MPRALSMESFRDLGPNSIGTALDQVTGSLTARVESGRYWCGSPTGVETPGLMTGIAGIGYTLLRHAHPRAVPSVLLLAASEPPLPPRS